MVVDPSLECRLATAACMLQRSEAHPAVEGGRLARAAADHTVEVVRDLDLGLDLVRLDSRVAVVPNNHRLAQVQSRAE